MWKFLLNVWVLFVEGSFCPPGATAVKSQRNTEAYINYKGFGLLAGLLLTSSYNLN